MMTRTLSGLALAGMLMAAQAVDAAPTTAHCPEPRAPAERLICTTPDLLRQDRALALAYQGAEERFDNGAPASAGVLADLRKSQQDWIADRDRCADASCLKSHYAARLANLALHPRANQSTPADHLAGEYGQEAGLALFAQVRDDHTLRIAIIGAEPASSNWVCDFDGVGTVEADGRITLRDPAQPNTTILTIQQTPTGLDIPDTPANRTTSEASCGANGSLLWPYTRKPAGP